eukprot:CAMPEP_0194161868 /NCGR_PEP_ID=MMETSP0152-20130528/79181_1 /TAXON_ID=1049557 /ORGANISM="Thalassiothrix antarctica, Strain L6-D1" /LENGTH=59 /DNA_ID=CAMNT_0038871709 /DNA_START=1414 /DNA_END=1593 /DNA_ORIENTATION=+
MTTNNNNSFCWNHISNSVKKYIFKIKMEKAEEEEEEETKSLLQLYNDNKGKKKLSNSNF